jgi:DNA-directed RNA polymerase specialized sigma24 family protein
VAYAICGDWHRADDLLQTAFVKLYVVWPRLRDPAAAEPYARRILVPRQRR